MRGHHQHLSTLTSPLNLSALRSPPKQSSLTLSSKRKLLDSLKECSDHFISFKKQVLKYTNAIL